GQWVLDGQDARRRLADPDPGPGLHEQARRGDAARSRRPSARWRKSSAGRWARGRSAPRWG
ncbi:MAG TPA: hypothetical protein VG370_00525, partial [Chloroflexota bacterium]|nr:hypothetical protein [Chloroflexota bacterium]